MNSGSLLIFTFKENDDMNSDKYFSSISASFESTLCNNELSLRNAIAFLTDSVISE